MNASIHWLKFRYSCLWSQLSNVAFHSIVMHQAVTTYMY
jgi:hypothetical protein